MVGGLASSARPEQLHKISKRRVLLKNYARDATPPLTSKSISIETNDAATGHKLQGMSKDIIIVLSWPTGGLSKVFKNWEYGVLSHVCTLLGLSY